MRYQLKVTLDVEVDAPTEFDANEILTDLFGSCQEFGVDVNKMVVTQQRKKK